MRKAGRNRGGSGHGDQQQQPNVRPIDSNKSQIKLPFASLTSGGDRTERSPLHTTGVRTGGRRPGTTSENAM